MTNFVPHDQYQQSLKKQTKKIKERYLRISHASLARMTVQFKFVAKCFLVLSLAAVGLLIIAALGFDLSFLKVDPENGRWIQIFGLVAMIPMVGLIHKVSNMTEGDKWRREYGKDIDLKCPHCADRVELCPPYECGFCGFADDWGLNKDLNADNGLALMNCSECEKEPIALMCPGCNNDIVLDLDAYNQAKQLDYGYEGTISGLRIAPRS